MNQGEIEAKLDLVRDNISILESILEKERRRVSKKVYEILVEQARPELGELRDEEARYLSELAKYSA